MPVHIGEARLVGDFTRYTSHFSFIELDTEPGHVPAKSRLRACAEKAPPGFVFSLIVPTVVASLEGGVAAVDAYKRAETIASVLDSKWWVVRTPAQVRPTRRARQQLSELFGRLRDSGRRIAWEPRGVWEDAAAADTARELDVQLVQDVAQQAPEPATILYSRILALGRGARVGLGLAAAVAERVRGFDEAFIVVEGRGAEDLQRVVLAAAAEPDDTSAPAFVGAAGPGLHRSPLVIRDADEEAATEDEEDSSAEHEEDFDEDDDLDEGEEDVDEDALKDAGEFEDDDDLDDEDENEGEDDGDDEPDTDDDDDVHPSKGKA